MEDTASSKVRPVEEILENHSEKPTGDTFGTETLVFTMLADQGLPEVLKISFLVATTVIGTVAGGIATAVFWNDLENPMLKAGAVSAIIALGVFAILGSVRKRSEVAEFAGSLIHPLEQLERIRDGLMKYQKELDQRTSRYFHCITQDKVITYFVLTQLSHALNKRIALVRKLLDDGSRRSVAAAYELLHKDLSFTDGATRESGSARKVKLVFLDKIAGELIANLNLSLDLLEKDMIIPGTEPASAEESGE